MSNLPADLAAVLDEESRGLHAKYECDLPLAFTPEDVLDPVRVSERLGQMLLSKNRSVVADMSAAAVSRTLNEMLTRRLDKEIGPGYVPREVRQLFESDPKDDDLSRANRLLLESVLRGDVRPLAVVRMAAVYEAVHKLPRRSALCLSGGGIRSATFALGILQGLARHGLLEQFDFLSTVSGGGYIGSWLTAWIYRHPRGIRGVVRELTERSNSADQVPSSNPSVLLDEPEPVKHLRTYSNYLNPRLGLLSADTWTLGAIVGRNLLIHWLLLIPLLAFVVAVPRLLPVLMTLFWAGNSRLTEGYRELSLFSLGFVALACAIGYISVQRPSSGVAKGTTRGFLAVCLLPLVVSAVSYSVLWAHIAERVRQPFWRLHLLGLDLSLLSLLLILGAAANVVGWATWVVAPRTELRGSRRWELLFAIVAGALGGVLVWASATRVLASPELSTEKYAIYVVGSVPLFLFSFLLAETVFAGAVSRWTDDDDREWWARAGGWVFVVITSWAIGASVVVFGPVAARSFPAWIAGVGGLAGFTSVALAQSSKTAAVVRGIVQRKGVLNLLVAVLAPLFIVILCSVISLGLNETIRRVEPHAGRVDYAIGAFDQLGLFLYASPWLVTKILITLGALTLITSFLFNINKFSLHGMYRNRLIRAYLGASNPFRDPNSFTGFDSEDNIEISRLADTLFLTRDNISNPIAFLANLASPPSPTYSFLRGQLTVETAARIEDPELETDEVVDAVLHDLNRLMKRRDLRDLLRAAGLPAAEPRRTSARLVWRRSTAFPAVLRDNRELLYKLNTEIISGHPRPGSGRAMQGRMTRPLLLVNTTLNLVGGDNLAWQQRKAEPFSFSPLHCGSFRVGYRASGGYGLGAQVGEGEPEGISLGTAMAISGAAASPNMGYHSSSAATLLMTIFNARLGWWLGNPARDRWADGQPRFSIKPLVDEAFGRTNDANRYIYVSDGGHFENLGLYEMVLRRCSLIVVSDAGNDSKRQFEDLGNAISKIRIDLGIPIKFEKGQTGVFSTGFDVPATAYCAVGSIEYQCVDGGATPGKLIYIKPGLIGSEPRDVIHYHAQNTAFPHESTADQWFSESQFESYRALGSHIIQELCGPEAPVELSQFATACAAHAAAATPQAK
jgi:hypothetical protein